MKGKGINAILLSLVFLMSFMLVGQINGNTNVQMIIPDVTTDEYAVEFFTEFDAGTGSGTLPTLEPFWTDIVNTERVEETGEDVYVAVLDTGLLPQWDFFFSEANIAADLGVGSCMTFSLIPAAIWWLVH